MLADRASIFPIIEAQIADALDQPAVMARAAELAAEWPQLSPLRMRVTLLALIDRVEVYRDRVLIHLHPRRLADLLQVRFTTSEATPIADEPTLLLSHPVRLRRAGKQVRMVNDHTDPFAPPRKPDPALIRLVARAHRFHTKLLSHNGKFGDLAKREQLNRSYFSRLLRIAYLAPDITAAILDGRQPVGVTASALIAMTDLPIGWREQRRILGFAVPG